MPTTAQIKHRLVIGKILEDPRMSIYRAMREVGYAHNTAIHPTKNLGKDFFALLEQELPDDMLMKVHKNLLTTKRIDHMVFPLGPKDEDEPNLSGSTPNAKNPMDDLTHPVERTTLTDVEIKDMLAEVGGTVRRIVHGQTARHVYFWVPNDKARQDALKLAYDLKGKLTNKEPITPVTTNNQFNQYNVNSPSARELADETVKILMEKTKRKVLPNVQQG